jgi:4-diphosphocytidyl-2-C-methyl-D-erythritol kinase
VAAIAYRHRTHPLSGLRAEAPAKLNLALAVSGRRHDGFHVLHSVFVRLALHDDLEVEPALEAQDEDGLVLLADEDIPREHDLVLRAAADLRAASGQPLPALRFSLTKRIPIAAGLAGGSSDAAAALDLAAQAWGLRLHPAERLQVALGLGADVPFFTSGHAAALVSGIGERLEPLPASDPPAGLVLVTPPEGPSTAEVFAELDRLDAPDDTAASGVDALVAAMRDGASGADLSGLAEVLRDANDLWPPARRLAPSLASLRDALEVSMRRPFLLTGSGTTLFAILPSAIEAEEAAERLRRERPAAIRHATVIATATVTAISTLATEGTGGTT